MRGLNGELGDMNGDLGGYENGVGDLGLWDLDGEVGDLYDGLEDTNDKMGDLQVKGNGSLVE
ncbi:unnamed protein product, partial [Larinioides sclopetarius]